VQVLYQHALYRIVQDLSRMGQELPGMVKVLLRIEQVKCLVQVLYGTV
jgi:hypothetical protein